MYAYLKKIQLKLTTASTVAPFRIIIPSTKSGFSNLVKQNLNTLSLNSKKSPKTKSNFITPSLFSENFDEIQMLP